MFLRVWAERIHIPCCYAPYILRILWADANGGRFVTKQIPDAPAPRLVVCG